MTVVKGIIREVGRSRTTRISAQRWYGSISIVVQNPETGKTYSVTLSSSTLQKTSFLPKVGMKVIIHGYVEEAEFGLSDFIVSRVVSIKHEGSEVKRIIRFDDD